MTKTHLENLINEKSQALAKPFLESESFKAKLEGYRDKDGNFPTHNLSLFALTEAMIFSRKLLSSVLSEVLPLDVD